MPDVEQTSNTVGGNQAGRDAISAGGDYVVGQFVNVLHQHQQGCATMRRLIEAFEVEVQSDQTFNDTVASLQRYEDNVDADHIIGLEEKLRLGGRDAEFARAVRMKENFTKKLTRFRLSKAAQELIGYVLARVEITFQHQIEPLIDAGVDQIVIQRALQEGIVQAIEVLLDSNPLLFDSAEVMGMVYYLTGNCHIRWHQV